MAAPDRPLNGDLIAQKTGNLLYTASDKLDISREKLAIVAGIHRNTAANFENVLLEATFKSFSEYCFAYDSFDSEGF